MNSVQIPYFIIVTMNLNVYRLKVYYDDGTVIFDDKYDCSKVVKAELIPQVKGVKEITLVIDQDKEFIYYSRNIFGLYPGE